MNFLKNIFSSTPKQRIRITRKNIKNWPRFQEKLESGKIRFDNQGRLRYSHGTPAGDLILSRIDKDGNPIYKESTNEWFDPESEMAENLDWSKFD